MALVVRPVALVAVALCFAVFGALALIVPPVGETASSAPEWRPDLVQKTPWSVQTKRTASGRDLLGFSSGVENRGVGPLRLDARRIAGRRDMRADQIVRRADGTKSRTEGVGTMRYTRSRGHVHWHLLGFDRYELRRASTHTLVRPDQKTGFCLGDRSEGDDLPRKPAQPVFDTNCRQGEPDARSLTVGISVGYADDYWAYLEGQSIDVTNISAGRYVLVHRVNGDRRLREQNYLNNASSVLLDLTRPNGMSGAPRAAVLKRCPGSARCRL